MVGFAVCASTQELNCQRICLELMVDTNAWWWWWWWWFTV